MKWLGIATEVATGMLRAFTPNWWIEIETAQPRCVYFFGPFDNVEEARNSQYGYIEDLIGEGAYGIRVGIKRCNPKVLTIYDSVNESGI